MESSGIPRATSDAPAAIQSASTASVSSQAVFVDVSTGQVRTWNPSIHFVRSTSDAWPEPPAVNTNGVTVLPLADALQQLRRIEGLDLNWDSYGSEPPTRRALAAARSLIWRVYEGSACAGVPLVPYAVVPLSGGGVQVEWRGVSDAIEIEVSAEGALSYLLVRGTGPTRDFDEREAVPEFRIVELVRSIR